MNPAGGAGAGAGAGAERCPHCLLCLDRGVHKPHVCSAAPSSSANIRRTVDDRSLWHYDASDGESSGTDLDHHRRNRRRRQQQPLDLEKGHRDGDGVGSDSSDPDPDPDPRFTLSDRRHQDRRASGKPDAKKQQNAVDLEKGRVDGVAGGPNAPPDGEMARGFWRTAWGFWRRLVHKARGEECINAGDATCVGGVIADNEGIKRGRRKGRTKRVSDSQSYDFKISDVRNENVREQRAARKTIQRREGRTEREESDRQHLEDGMTQMRKEQNERSKQRAARRGRDTRTRIENQLAYESRPKRRDTQRDSEKKELDLVRQQEMNAKRREDLLNERRAKSSSFFSESL